MPSISPAEPFSLRDYLGFVQFSFDDPVQLGNHTLCVNLGVFLRMRHAL